MVCCCFRFDGTSLNSTSFLFLTAEQSAKRKLDFWANEVFRGAGLTTLSYMCSMALQHKLSKTLQNMITSWAPTCRKLRKKKVEFSLDFHTAICMSSDLLSTICIAIV